MKAIVFAVISSLTFGSTSGSKNQRRGNTR